MSLQKVYLKLQAKNKIPGLKLSPKIVRIQRRRNNVLPNIFLSSNLLPCFSHSTFFCRISPFSLSRSMYIYIFLPKMRRLYYVTLNCLPWISSIKNLAFSMNCPTTLLYDWHHFLGKQDVFVKHECPRNGHFLRNVTFIFDLDLCR